MLTENDIVDKVSEYLKKDGYKILQKLGTSEKGVDIIAQKNNINLYVEAKGETSSKEGSKRWKKSFSQNQVKTHVAMAILASMKILNSMPGEFTRVAVAFPDNKDHRDLVRSVSCILKKIGINIYMVGDDSIVEI